MIRDPVNRGQIFKSGLTVHTFASTYFLLSIYRQYQFEKQMNIKYFS